MGEKEEDRKTEVEEVEDVDEEQQRKQLLEVRNEDVLQFLDSTDSYLTLFDSLSSTLRQGWLELASARHSMGASRVSSALLDLKLHSASTSLQITQDNDFDCKEEKPLFILQKWASFDNGRCYSVDAKSKEAKLQGESGTELRNRGNSQLSEEKSSKNGTMLMVDDQVQKERSKSLSMFGTLVSPKLRAAQLSFETALETIVEIANMRSVMLSTFGKVHKELEASKRSI